MNPLDNLIHFFVVALLIAVTAFVYSYVLVQPGELFAKLFVKLDILFRTDARAQQGKGPHPLFKMIMWCEKCVAGQLSLWIYLSCAWPWYCKGQYLLIISHILFIGLTIFLTLCVKKFYLKHIQ